MTLLGLLNNRYDIAKGFTKKFHDLVKSAVNDYEIENDTRTGVYNKHVTSSNESVGKVPYIFGTHESMLASLFESMPDIITSGRSSKNQTKANILKALYSYLEDKLDLDEFLADSAWWFFLTGFISAQTEYKIEIEGEYPQLDSNSQPMMDEDGQPVTIPKYAYHDPAVTVSKPLKTFFSPESEFSVDGKKVPYYLTEKLVDIDEISSVYGQDVQADETLDVDGYDAKKDSDQTDLKRAKVMYYAGRLPSHVKDDPLLKEIAWEYGKEFKVIFTKDKVLHVEESQKMCSLARFYGVRSKFFGFGIGKSLKSFQEDMSIRRDQMINYGNMFAFPWLTVHSETTVDQKAIQDKKKRTPLNWSGEKPPEYLVPPTLPQTIAQVDEANRSDAQFVSGTLDLSKGAQQTNTVKTATGQQLFAQSQDKRLQKARKAIAKYYREVVINLMKLCRDNWDDQVKEITYLNEDGEEVEAQITAVDLQDIDFDTDVDFSLDSISVNKDIISQRWISLLEQSKDLPFVNLPKVYTQTLRNAFSIPNPEAYVREEQVDPNTGQPLQPGLSQQSMVPSEEMPQQEQTMDQPIGASLSPQSGAQY